ncbi:MAG TPA: murein biosynthesis integral membrane protein MurJ [Vicinamibacterales bacterium]|nr:murein biosynthesis integral membrane protein MurJ [Vicinamibacterales bacterium]
MARSAGLIGAATFTSRVLGLVRDQATAHYFGTSWAADAFVVATRIPTLLRDLFAEGAMSAAFVPTLTRTLEKEGRPAAWRLGSQVINGLLIVTGILVLLGIVFADQLTSSYAAKFASIPGKLELTVELTRINMPFLMLIALAAACMGMLNALRRFTIPAVAPATYNVVFILSIITLVPVFTGLGWQPVTALSVGMLGGGLAQLLIQLPALRKEGYRHQWILNPRDSTLHEVLVLMGPGTLGVAAAQVNLFVNTALATGVDGAATALRYAFQLMYLPIGIFGVSVATAAIPELARQAAANSHEDMRRTVSWGIRLMLVLSIPAIVGLMVLARPIIELIFQHGKFDAASTTMTAGALMFYASGILGYSIVKIVSPSFYSLREARTPVVVSLITIAVNLALNLWLNSIYSFRGLALGTAIAANFNAGILMLLLSRRIGGGDFARIGRTFAKISVAAAVMGLAAYYTEAWLHGLFPAPHFMPRLIRVGGAIGVALAVLAGTAHLLRLEEFSVAMGRILGRLRR